MNMTPRNNQEASLLLPDIDRELATGGSDISADGGAEDKVAKVKVKEEFILSLKVWLIELTDHKLPSIATFRGNDNSYYVVSVFNELWDSLPVNDERVQQIKDVMHNASKFQMELINNDTTRKVSCSACYISDNLAGDHDKWIEHVATLCIAGTWG